APDGTGDAQGFEVTTHEGRLAGTKIAGQEHYDEFLVPRAGARQARRERLSLPFGANPVAHTRVLHRLTQWCSSRVRSLASTPRSPARAAASPAMACTKTPTRAALQWS